MNTGELDTGEIHDVLRNDRRRLALNALRDAGGELSVKTLAELVSEHETGETPAPRNIRQSVYVSLHQTHLPKLAELGIIEYDEQNKVVRLASRVHEIEAYMEVEPTFSPTWAEYYFGVSVVGLLTVSATALSLPYVSIPGAVGWAVLCFVLICSGAGYQIYVRELGAASAK